MPGHEPQIRQPHPLPPRQLTGKAISAFLALLRSVLSFQFLGFCEHGVDAVDVFAFVGFAQGFQGVEALGFDHAEADFFHFHGLFQAADEAILEVQGLGQFHFVDPAGAGAVFPEGGGQVLGRLILGRAAEAVGVFGNPVHDVGDRYGARAADVAVVAGGTHPHGGGAEHFVPLAGADHHEDFLGAVDPAVLEMGGTGAGTETALHAHLHPFAHLCLFFDFPQEVVLIAGRHLFIEFAHGSAPGR